MRIRGVINMPKTKPSIIILNLPELKHRPEWGDIEAVFRNGAEDMRVQFVLHLLALHVGGHRKEGEGPTTPAEERTFWSGAAHGVEGVMTQIRALLQGRGNDIPVHIRKHFGWKAEGRGQQAEEPS